MIVTRPTVAEATRFRLRGSPLLVGNRSTQQRNHKCTDSAAHVLNAWPEKGAIDIQRVRTGQVQ